MVGHAIGHLPGRGPGYTHDDRRFFHYCRHVILSTMIVVLTLASQQYGPRLLKNFIEDRPSQFVIGTLAACFIYSILILGNIRSGDFTFVPQLSVFIAICLVIASIGLMIFFVYHISVQIQVQSIMARVHADLRGQIGSMFPESIGRALQGDRMSVRKFDAEHHSKHTIRARAPGYLQAVRGDVLLKTAQEQDAVVKILPHTGDFVFENDPIAFVYSVSKKENEVLNRSVYDALILGRFPTSEQDIRFPINQLEEMAVRSLSPGINDPHTAIECIDYLASAMCELADREFPGEERCDEDGKIRLIVNIRSFDALMKSAFLQIQHYGRGSPRIMGHLFKVLGNILESCPLDSEQRSSVRELADRLIKDTQGSMQSKPDLDQVLEIYRRSFGD